IGNDGAVPTGADDVDLFKVVLDAPGVLTVSASAPTGGTPFDPYLRLFNSSGTEIGAADNSGPDPYPLLQSGRLPAGTYYFDVNARDGPNAPYPVTGVDSFLRIFDANLNEIDSADNDQVGVLTDSFLEVQVTAGHVYYVAVTTFGNRTFNPTNPFDRTSTTPGAVGDYDLYLSLDNGDVNGTIFESIPANIGEPVDGQISADGGERVGADGSKDVDCF